MSCAAGQRGFDVGILHAKPDNVRHVLRLELSSGILDRRYRILARGLVVESCRLRCYLAVRENEKKKHDYSGHDVSSFAEPVFPDI
jgi:hypothetical protein